MTFGNIPTSRREFLSRNALGIGSVALAWLMKEERLLGMPANVPKKRADVRSQAESAAQPEPQAKAMISLFMHGGPPHMDLTEPKPLLTKFSGTDYSGEVTYSFVNAASKKLLGSPFRFRKHGQCGTELSEAVAPHGQNRRRHLRRPLDAHRYQRPRAVDLVHEHGPGTTGPPGARVVDHLRPGLRKPEPAGLHRHARSGRTSRSTACATGPTAGCRPSSRRP